MPPSRILNLDGFPPMLMNAEGKRHIQRERRNRYRLLCGHDHRGDSREIVQLNPFHQSTRDEKEILAAFWFKVWLKEEARLWNQIKTTCNDSVQANQNAYAWLKWEKGGRK